MKSTQKQTTIMNMNKPELDIKEVQTFKCEDIGCIVGEEGSLGKGSFGVVRAGFHKTLGAIAAKCIPFSGRYAEKKKFIKKISDEVKHLQHANHDNVVRLLGLSSWEGFVAIIMEYLPSGNLMEMLRDKDVPIGTLLRLRISDDIANGISFIHNLLSGKRLVHGDLKAENILLTNSLRCKIADFGGSVLSNLTGNTTTLRGRTVTSNEFTEIYAAPELLKNQAMKLIPSNDTYSYGMIIYLILRREGPVTDQSVKMPYLEDIKKGERPELDIKELTDPEACDQSKAVLLLLYEKMKECWQQNARDRPDMRDVRDELHHKLVQFPPSRINDQVTEALRELEVAELSLRQHECVALDKLPLRSVTETELPDASMKHSTPRSASPKQPQQNRKKATLDLPRENPTSLTSSSCNMQASLHSSSPSFSAKEKKGEMNTNWVSLQPTPRVRKNYVEVFNYDEIDLDRTISARSPLNASPETVSPRNPLNIEAHASRLPSSSTPQKSPTTPTDATKPAAYVPPHRKQSSISSSSRSSTSDLRKSSYSSMTSLSPSGQEFATFDNKKLRRYDATSYRFKVLPEFNHCHSDGSMVMLDDKIYMIGGWKNQKMEMLDLNQPFQWKDMKSTTEPFIHSASAVSNGFIYVVGGRKWKSPESSCLKYYPAEDCWINISDMNIERHGHALAALGDYLYVIGGRNRNSSEVYNPSTDKWNIIPATKTPRDGLAAVTMNGKVFAIGGACDWKELNSIESYDPRESKWETFAYLKVARQDHGACVINDRMFVIGGKSDLVEVFDFRAGKWDYEGAKEFRGVNSVVALWS